MPSRRTLFVVCLIACGASDAEQPVTSSPEPVDDQTEQPTPLWRATHARPELAVEPPTSAESEPDTRVETAQEHLRALLERAPLEGALAVAADSVATGHTMLRFYENRGFRLAFIDERGRSTPNVDALLQVVNAATDHGLTPTDYHVDALRSLRPSAESAPADLAAFDLLLVDAFLTYGSHLLHGKVDPIAIFPSWTARRRTRDLLELLSRSLQEGRVAEALRALTPDDAGYERLQTALRAMRDRSWPSLGSSPTPEAILAHLRHLGDVDDAEPELAPALRAFQRRHGLAETGTADERTLAQLQVSHDQRVQTLRVNLERWRWLPEDLGTRHVYVNIPAFEMQYVEDGETRLRMRAIVGKTYRKTPVFSDTIRYLVLNPTWTAPPTVVRSDLLPDLRRDPRLLERRGLQVVARDGAAIDPGSVRWRNVRPGEVVFRQPPGPNNALGPVKFMFPNSHDVYLHGTPRQDLFEENERTFSSGCVRLERPLELASVLLGGEWTGEALQAVVRTRQPRTLNLRPPVPVHLMYATAWVDAEGTLQFRRDVYERDAAVLEALGVERPDPIARARAQSDSSG